MTSALLKSLIVAPFLIVAAALFLSCVALEWFGDVQRAARSRVVPTPDGARPRSATLARRRLR
jgi:hypothetical protein